MSNPVHAKRQPIQNSSWRDDRGGAQRLRDDARMFGIQLFCNAQDDFCRNPQNCGRPVRRRLMTLGHISSPLSLSSASCCEYAYATLKQKQTSICRLTTIGLAIALIFFFLKWKKLSETKVKEPSTDSHLFDPDNRRSKEPEKPENRINGPFPELADAPPTNTARENRSGQIEMKVNNKKSAAAAFIIKENWALFVEINNTQRDEPIRAQSRRHLSDGRTGYEKQFEVDSGSFSD